MANKPDTFYFDEAERWLDISHASVSQLRHIFSPRRGLLSAALFHAGRRA